MQQAIVTNTKACFNINGIIDLKDFFRIQKANEPSLDTFLRDGYDPLSNFSFLWVHQPDHFGK
jgi:hypothetical protein